MTAPSLWTRHRHIARIEAAAIHLPGSERQDVEQEALIALWEAARTHDPGQSSFPHWARTVIRRHLADCLRVATSARRQILTSAERDGDHASPYAWFNRDDREDVRAIVALAHDLTQPERAALRRIIDGSPLEGKADDNLRYRVRRKLRARLNEQAAA